MAMFSILGVGAAAALIFYDLRFGILYLDPTDRPPH
jgi:hypothetical protein